MFTNMKGLINQVKQLSAEVSVSSGAVASSSEKFLKASQDISTAVNEIEQGIFQQAKDAEDCLHHMDDLSCKIVTVSESTKKISELVENTRGSISDGTVVTRELNRQTKDTMEIATVIIREIEELNKSSLSITNIIKVINEISNQTNLLSLNASIEAARAGVHGRGFSVVAEEIRKLSDQSWDSINVIQEITKKIQLGTTNISSIAKKVENVMQLQEVAVDNTTKSYQNINNCVEMLSRLK